MYPNQQIDKNRVRLAPKKIIAVKNFPVPKTQKNVKQCLDLAGYYRRFLEGFSKIANLSNHVLQKDIPFNWTEKQQTAVDIFKAKLCEVPLLQRSDFSHPFILTIDASGFVIGGILSQEKISKDKPIEYA